MEKKVRRSGFIEGTFFATTAIIIVKILGMLYVVPFYKIVGSQGGALYSYAYNIYLLFLEISSAGLPNAISKIISEYDTLGYANTKKRAFNLAKKILLFISIVVFLILFVFAEEIGMFIIGDIEGGNTFQDIAFVIRCVAPAVIVVPFLSITKGYLQGHKVIAPSSISQVVEQVVRIFVILTGSYLVLNILHKSLSLAVGIAVSGAFFGALAALITIQLFFKKNSILEEDYKKTKEEEKIRNRDIVKKIIRYSIPFVIISIVTNIYNFTDQIIVLRTISKLGYSTTDVEFIASSIATWSPKICMAINALAMGMSVPLIPTIVSAFTKKDKVELNDKINRSITLVFFLSVPVEIGIFSLATPVWTLFYNTNPYGGMILQLAVVSALAANVYMIVSIILQSLNKYALVYKCAITGFVCNAVFDIPWMLFFHYVLHQEAFLGSIVSSICGFTISSCIGCIGLRRLDKDISFLKSFIWFGKISLCGFIMIIPLLFARWILPFDVTTISGAIYTILILFVIGAPIYIFVTYKMGLIKDLMGEETWNKIVRKVTFGKFGKKA